MSTNNPNRNKAQSADRTRMRYKQSGDQHIFPEDETAQAPRVHRLSREDMHKLSSAPPSDTEDQE